MLRLSININWYTITFYDQCNYCIKINIAKFSHKIVKVIQMIENTMSRVDLLDKKAIPSNIELYHLTGQQTLFQSILSAICYITIQMFNISHCERNTLFHCSGIRSLLYIIEVCRPTTLLGKARPPISDSTVN